MNTTNLTFSHRTTWALCQVSAILTSRGIKHKQEIATRTNTHLSPDRVKGKLPGQCVGWLTQCWLPRHSLKRWSSRWPGSGNQGTASAHTPGTPTHQSLPRHTAWTAGHQGSLRMQAHRRSYTKHSWITLTSPRVMRHSCSLPAKRSFRLVHSDSQSKTLEGF